ncbi:hypothetical protein [Mesorhizobium sp. ZC-5]|uniref:hypothetical protein n=1 Tax=Mesorhizobium sp. ZC-5 TaxID=2986066 RepID=UPI0021E9609C|nr:hypothetical protein [Mesorhizobium sp. ZC-5]MCV3239680.1 hypothetical protein [Mesorhizobium sp. ZC-5]
MSIVLGGFLGGGAAKLLDISETRRLSALMQDAGRVEFDAATDVLHNDLQLLARQSVGAAAAAKDTLDDLTIAGGAASKVAAATAQLNPLLRTLQSPSLAVRGIASQMMDAPVYLRKNMRGAGDTAAETAVHEFARGGVVQAMEIQRDAFMKARKGGTVISEKAFREEVGKAMRRNDVSDIPGVSEAAKAWRSKVIEPLKQRAIQEGMLPHDVHVSTADSYLSRLYNRPAIEANEADFKKTVRQWLSGSLDKEIAGMVRKADSRLMNLQREKNELGLGIERRNEARRAREQDGEILPDEMSEEDIVSFVRRVKSGEQPQQPESLSQWLKRQKGGIYDPNGEIAAVFSDARSVPGLLRKSLKSRANQKGGEGLDNIVQRAWEEGFFNGAATVRAGLRPGAASERPTIRDFLDALDSDVRGQRVVRIGDEEAARAADDFDRVIAAMDRAGVDINGPKFATSESLKDIAATVNRVLDDLDREKMARLDVSMKDMKQRGPLDFVSDADRDAYLDEIVADIFDKVTGRVHDGDVPANIVVSKRGPLKERTFNIPDHLIERYLESDAELIGRRYARVMAADVELTARFGSPDMKSAIGAIREDYAELRKGVTDKAKTDKLLAREKADIRDIEGVRDLLRGHYRPEIQHTTWARIGRAANTFNYVRALGGVVVSSLTDAVRPAMVHGLAAYTEGAIKPMIRNMSAVKMSMKEAKLAGAISERWLASRLATMAEITDPYSVHSPFERFLENAAVGFTKMTGLLHWNDFQKGIAATLTQNRILKNAELAAAKGFDALPAKEQAYMGFLGIGQGRAEDIGKLFAAHGETLDGVRIAGSEAWGDDQAIAALRRSYRAAINKDVDSIIVTKGVGDVPLMANTPIGRALLQFRSFAIASNQRVLIRGLQEDTTRFVSGVVGMSLVGMFVYWLKQMESGREISNNPGTWIAEGVDRSGIFSMAFEVNNAFEKIGGPGAFTAASLAGGMLVPGSDKRQPASRFAVRSRVGSFLGPSFEAATDSAGLLALGFENMRRAANGEEGVLSEGDIASLRRLTPYASLPYWRWFLDGMVIPELKERVAR